ncbi:MAG TPA: hypothetical protein DEF57_00585 [Candidatus Magasanikbacteria bacterium]|nr:hypothetical protein [Candidatus Magasanikbacteria bacterium]
MRFGSRIKAAEILDSSSAAEFGNLRIVKEYAKNLDTTCFFLVFTPHKGMEQNKFILILDGKKQILELRRLFALLQCERQQPQLQPQEP